MRLRNKTIVKFSLIVLVIWVTVYLIIYEYFTDSPPTSGDEIKKDRPPFDGLSPDNQIPGRKKRKRLNGDQSFKDSAEVKKRHGKHSLHENAQMRSQMQHWNLNETDLGRDVLLGMILTDADATAFRDNEKHDFNVFLSDKMSLARPVPDVRPPGCSKRHYSAFPMTVSVVICFHNEALSALLRTVQSIISRSGENLIAEILLVDDASQLENLGEELVQRLSTVTTLVGIIRLTERNGLMRARIRGARESRGDVIVFMDSHCEVGENWLEPLLEEISKNRTTVACPVIDIIQSDTLEYAASPAVRGGFNWGLHFRWDSLLKDNVPESEAYSSPAMAGGIFAINRQSFSEIGEYDEAMSIWGGENIELSLRIWMCGGSIRIVPCSRVGHIFRSRRPYSNDGQGDTHLTNSVRLAHVWLGKYIEKFFEARPEARHVMPGDISSRLALKSKLHCQSFQWYLENVYPDAIQQPAFSRQEPAVSRYTDKFRLLHVSSGLCLSVNYTKNDPVMLTPCDKTHRQMVYQADDSSRAIVLAKKLCLDSDCSGIEDRSVICAAKCHFTGGSQAWIFSKTTTSTLLLNLAKGLCLAFDGDMILARCNEKNDLLRWRLEK